ERSCVVQAGAVDDPRPRSIFDASAAVVKRGDMVSAEKSARPRPILPGWQQRREWGARAAATAGADGLGRERPAPARRSGCGTLVAKDGRDLDVALGIRVGARLRLAAHFAPDASERLANVGVRAGRI